MEPFFTTKKAGLGTGVGLSLSRAIAKDHGGDLTLCDDTDHTRFRLTLPAGPQVASSADAAPPQGARLRLPGATILVVDDEAVLRGIFKKWLLAIGCGKVVSAENGEAALAVIKTEKIDLMITDLHMPIMDGTTLLRRIVEMGRSIPSVLFVSASADIQAEAMYALGVEAFISKPFDRDKLVETMERALGERSVLWGTPLSVAPTQSIEIPLDRADSGAPRQEVRLGNGGFSARYLGPLSFGQIAFCCYYPNVGQDMTGQGIVRWRSVADKTVGIEFIFLEDGCRAWVQRAIAAANPPSFIPSFASQLPD